MIIENTATIGELLTSSGVIFTAVGLMLNIVRIRKESIRTRSEFMLNLRNQFISNDGMNAIFYKIEHGKLRREDISSGSEDERNLDKLLYFYDGIARHYEAENIKEKNLECMAYEFIRVSKNLAVRDYIDFVKSLSSNCKIKDVPFSAFMRVGKLLEEQNKKNSE